MSDTDLRFGRGAPRSEDEPLLAGRGRFTDDLAPAGSARAAFVRSPHGHAWIRGIDTKDAAGMPGVLAVITGAELSLGAIPPGVLLPGRDGKPMFATQMPVLATDRVRYVGEPVALVVAETLAQALDAVDAVEADYEALPAASDVGRALAPGAPALYAEAAGQSPPCPSPTRRRSVREGRWAQHVQRS
jgi:carbon-monoxide dehydrogenase large subunit